VNPKKTYIKHSDFGKPSVADVPSPFELAQTAIALCQLRRSEHPGIYPQPENYFKPAKKLLADAGSYLAIDWKEYADRAADTLFSRFPKNQTISFGELLQPSPSGEKSKGKKLTAIKSQTEALQAQSGSLLRLTLLANDELQSRKSQANKIEFRKPDRVADDLDAINGDLAIIKVELGDLLEIKLNLDAIATELKIANTKTFR
jgi:hypothetical protein